MTSLSSERGASDSWACCASTRSRAILLTVIAIVVSPLLAIAFVAAAGVTPQFRELTNGGPLPIVPQMLPFIVAWTVGLLCLAAVTLPSLIMAREGVLAQRFRAARPPGASLIHRYHLDVVAFVLGGLVFWGASGARADRIGRTLRGSGRERDAVFGAGLVPDSRRAAVHAPVPACRELRRRGVAARC